MKYYKILVSAVLLLMLATLQAEAQDSALSFTNEDWTVGLSGNFPVFLVASNANNYSSNGEDQFSTRIMSGFIPAFITLSVKAPDYNGVSVSGNLQIDSHLQGPSIQNDGLFESRIAEIVISGTFGTFNVGKGFGLFNSLSIADAGSGMGVGRFGSPDAADATLGRIGTGYTYANFNPRITYTTPSFGGLLFKIALINPEKPGGLNNRSADIETSTPRLEGQIEYKSTFTDGMFQIWGSGLYQSVKVVIPDYSYSFSGWEFGAKFNTNGFTLQGSYSQTNSIGADGLIGLNISGGSGLDQADIDGAQWYAEATYDFGKTVLGGSYGQGSQDAGFSPVGSSPSITNKLGMGFARFTMTPNLTLMLELQDFQSDVQADYNAVVVGTQFSF